MNAFVNVDAEKSVLGAILQDPSCLGAMDELSEYAFTTLSYQRAVGAALALHREGKPVDLLTVGTEVKQRHGIDLASTLLDAVRWTPTTANAKSYLAIVRECAKRRALRETCQRVVGSLGEVDADDAVDGLLIKLREMITGRSGWTTFGDVGAATFDMLDAIAKGQTRVIRTGMPDLDAALAGGLRNGEVTVVAAGTGQGKSAFAMQLALAAARAGVHVGVVSREMSAEQYGIRALASMAGVDSGTMLQAKALDAAAWGKITEAIDGMRNVPIDFLFRSATVEDVRREVIRQKDIGLLVVDYLQILDTAQKCATEHLRVSTMSRQLKLLAMDMGIPVVVLSQLRRQPNGAQRRPALSDLKESGSIENDADSVIFLWQPNGPDDSEIPNAYTGWVEAAEGMGDRFLLVEIAKQRMYATSTLGLCFAPSEMRFYTPQKGAKG